MKEHVLWKLFNNTLNFYKILPVLVKQKYLNVLNINDNYGCQISGSDY